MTNYADDEESKIKSNDTQLTNTIPKSNKSKNNLKSTINENLPQKLKKFICILNYKYSIYL